MRLAILGGSFNPVHFAHLALAADALETFGYDRIILVPSFRPPHKGNVELAKADDRLDMLAAAVEGDRRFQVDDCEIRRQGLSYTFDTVDEIELRYRPEGKLGFLLGDDLVGNYPSWKLASKLAERVDLILARRSAGSSPPFPYPHRKLDNPFIDISSTAIRGRIAQGRSWAFMMPRETGRVIEERALYGFSGRKSGPSAFPSALSEAVERSARTAMPSSRFFHSRGVALSAAGLCSRFGLDPERGYLAGIGHDLAKDLELPEIRALALTDGRGESAPEAARPSLLHARASAVLLNERFFVKDADVLQAVALHTFAAAGMSALAKIVYIADKLEPSRPDVPIQLRDLADTGSLDDLFTAVLSDTVRKLRTKGKSVSEETLALLADYAEGGR
ncbi:MAG: nicotinate (nicotinamide) nucleotide adenylyltransferase [Treponema sp. GWB1_62_6]|nr:MAG: nicotinate (nicotinamide) nucleotide adenylyltransferase [Treponema sp. GWA1_62_8]OHE69330.1 MAG: nicotinate (nicotinamide) nucleotide adenylyltransferase [Treponema sp. GWC1_61_84]OHE70735.1 MAG: nicotinate (nicotinamide) nucleotide adenylyltransferase [Treponema sp. GWB1_62_6]HCM26256.1 nicotinate (nicotinamide) nucleotide adenylyltransferase [Treponema sp.]